MLVFALYISGNEFWQKNGKINENCYENCFCFCFIIIRYVSFSPSEPLCENEMSYRAVYTFYSGAGAVSSAVSTPYIIWKEYKWEMNRRKFRMARKSAIKQAVGTGLFWGIGVGLAWPVMVPQLIHQYQHEKETFERD